MARSIAFRGRGEGMGDPELGEPDQVNSLRSSHGGAADMVMASVGIQTGATVRRLTPLERERLMGWEDDHTAWGIDEHGQQVELSDTARDRLTGNGVVTSVARWIGDRIYEVHNRQEQA